jgi:hypothetical protein
LTLYDILVPYFQDKARKEALRALKGRWKDAGWRLANAMEEHKPAMIFKKKMEEDLSAAESVVKDTIAKVNTTKKELGKLKDHDKGLVRLLS